MKSGLMRAITIAGGQASLAKACGVLPSRVWYWVRWAKRLPPHAVITIERITGVSHNELTEPDTQFHYIPITDVLEKFGEPNALARALNAPPSTVGNWVRKGYIPASRWQSILDAAQSLGIPLDGLVLKTKVVPEHTQSYVTRDRNDVSSVRLPS